MSAGVEFRVKWRSNNGERQGKRFSDRDTADAFIVVLAGVSSVTDVRLQARRVEAWRDVET